MDIKKTAQFLTALRKKHGMTQQDAADALHLSNKTISKWESGSGLPDISVLPALAELYGVSVDEILAGEAAETPFPKTETREKQAYLLRRAQLKVKISLVFAMVFAASWCFHTPAELDTLSAFLCPALILTGWFLMLDTVKSEKSARRESVLLAAWWTLPAGLVWERGFLQLYFSFCIETTGGTPAGMLKMTRWREALWALAAICTLLLLYLLVKILAEARFLPGWILVLCMGGLLEYGLGSVLLNTRARRGANTAAEVWNALRQEGFWDVVPALQIAMWVIGILLAAFILIRQIRRHAGKPSAKV